MINHVEAMSRWADASSVIAHSMGQRRTPGYLSALALDMQRQANSRWLPQIRSRSR